VKHTCVLCGGVLSASTQDKLDKMIIVHAASCPQRGSLTKKPNNA
jgi:hypothetical protein